MIRYAWKVGPMVAFLLFVPRIMNAEPIVWARGATHFGNECKPPQQECRLAHVIAPNHRDAIDVTRAGNVLRIEAIEGTRDFSISLPEDLDAEINCFVEMEILWAPDSSAVSFAWNASAITEQTRIYAIGKDGVRPIDLSVVRKSFVRLVPPCVGVEGQCDLSGAWDNYLTVAWSAPHTLVLMAEVPPSSSYGANMGKVIGYEFDVDTGEILRTMKTAEFKRRWQSRMGWNIGVKNAQ